MQKITERNSADTQKVASEITYNDISESGNSGHLSVENKGALLVEHIYAFLLTFIWFFFITGENSFLILRYFLAFLSEKVSSSKIFLYPYV